MKREWRRALETDSTPVTRREVRYPTAHETAALRSRLVANLTGLPRSRLQNWHATLLQPAHRRAGARGTPRLYSWIDYQRLCVVASLVSRGVPVGRIRVALTYLDDLFPDWHQLSLEAWAGGVSVPGASSSTHVALKHEFADVLADAAGQMTYRSTLAFEWDDASSDALADGLVELRELGSLYRLHSFGDSVVMNPDINVGLPTLVGSRLETAFLFGLVELSSVDEVAGLYRLPSGEVRRACAFELEAAA